MPFPRRLLPLAAVLLIPLALPAQEESAAFTIEEMMGQSIYSRMPRGLGWLPTGDRFTEMQRSEDGVLQLIIRYAATGAEHHRIAPKVAGGENGQRGHGGMSLGGLQWLPDGDGFVFIHGGDIWEMMLDGDSPRRLTDTPDSENEVGLSPDGRRIAFVREQDLYVLERASGDETRLTVDGGAAILNGTLDWVYQEELVGRGTFRGYFWSPDGERLAFLRFDQSPVPTYPLVDWLPTHPDLEQMRYPKAGDPNSQVRLGTVAATGGAVTWLDSLGPMDGYIPRVWWSRDSRHVLYIHLARSQQRLDLRRVDARGGESRVLITESDSHWVDLNEGVHVFQSEDRILWPSERSGFNHLYLYGANGTLIRPVTRGDWVVDQLAGVDEEGGWIYFTATRADRRERHLYRIRVDGSGMEALTSEPGTHRITLAPSGRYFIDAFSSVTHPLDVAVFETGGGRTVDLADAGDELTARHRMSTPELFRFTGGNGIEYDAMITRPVDFDPTRRYPVIVSVYGGPHSQSVRNRRGSMWDQYLAGRGYVVFEMDNRGSDGRGQAWEGHLFRRFGAVELADQLEGVAWLKTQSYVDPERIGITGGSYGGFMVAYAMTHSDAFRAGIALFGVYDWRLYDTAYTERYLGLPQENEEGYTASSPIHAAGDLSGRLLLVHGAYDENVHMQNYVQFSDALIKAGKQFDSMLYPNEGHGIHHPARRRHYYGMQIDFWERCLKGE